MPDLLLLLSAYTILLPKLTSAAPACSIITDNYYSAYSTTIDPYYPTYSILLTTTTSAGS